MTEQSPQLPSGNVSTILDGKQPRPPGLPAVLPKIKPPKLKQAARPVQTRTPLLSHHQLLDLLLLALPSAHPRRHIRSVLSEFAEPALF